MIRLAIERCFENQDITGILIDPLKSNTNAHRFYERIGFEFLEQRSFDDTGCYVYELKRNRVGKGESHPYRLPRGNTN